MKKINLVFPSTWGEYPNNLLFNNVWLKIADDKSEVYKDIEFKQQIMHSEDEIFLTAQVPDNLEIIEVTPPKPINPVTSIWISWIREMEDITQKVTNLKNVYVIFNNMVHEVDVINGKPDADSFEEFCKSDDKGRWLFLKSWALVVYVMEIKCIGVLYWTIRKNMQITVI